MNNLNVRGHSRRKLVNRLMLAMSCTAAGIAILILALILGYILIRGISYLNLNILTKAAEPMGETGEACAMRFLARLSWCCFGQ